MALVNVSAKAGVARMVLASPPLNIITRKMMEEIRSGLESAAADSSVRVLLLSAEGKHFSAGADVAEHMPPEHEQLIPEFTETVTAVHDFPLPTIAAVQGRCLGGGFELVQPADIVVAAESASFGQPEIMLGVTAPIASVLLPRKGNIGYASEILFTGDPYSAADAKDAGFVARVVPDGELEETALELAARIARHSAASLRLAKKTMRVAANKNICEALEAAGTIYVDELMNTDDASEGLNAFTEKRRPSWSNS